jgi:hypothetical protein
LIGAIHETDVTQPFPLLSWREVVIPLDAGRVQAIAVQAARRRIVLGCDRGVWWSSIPASSAHGAGYSWTRVAGIPDCTYAGLAATGDDTFVAAAYGSNADSGAYGMFRGSWSGSAFTMNRSAVAAVDPRLISEPASRHVTARGAMCTPWAATSSPTMRIPNRPKRSAGHRTALMFFIGVMPRIASISPGTGHTGRGTHWAAFC